MFNDANSETEGNNVRRLQDAQEAIPIEVQQIAEYTPQLFGESSKGFYQRSTSKSTDLIPESTPVIPHSAIDQDNPLANSIVPIERHSKQKSHGTPTKRSHQLRTLHAETRVVDLEQ